LTTGGFPALIKHRFVAWEAMTLTNEARLTSPAALRNRDPILAVLRTALPQIGRVLEIASGSGEHIVHFAKSLPGLTWIPSDPSAEARASISAWLEAESYTNVLAPLDIDASTPAWPIDRVNAIIAINMVHISPWAATLGLLAGAKRILPQGGTLFFYGPYSRSDERMAQGNIDFEADLRSRNPEWGIRRLEDLVGEADLAGLRLASVTEMPANNLSLVFVRV
jgi:cyclopropane fatty-acyl-phospholipid synthase-like methyltransferase